MLLSTTSDNWLQRQPILWDKIRFLLSWPIEDSLWNDILRSKEIIISIIKEKDPRLDDHIISAYYNWQWKKWVLWHYGLLCEAVNWNEAKMELVWWNIWTSLWIEKANINQFIPWFMKKLNQEIKKSNFLYSQDIPLEK